MPLGDRPAMPTHAENICCIEAHVCCSYEARLRHICQIYAATYIRDVGCHVCFPYCVFTVFFVSKINFIDLTTINIIRMCSRIFELFLSLTFKVPVSNAKKHFGNPHKERIRTTNGSNSKTWNVSAKSSEPDKSQNELT